MSVDGLQTRTRTYLDQHPRLWQIPACSFFVGFVIGTRRGARTTSLRFLAENAHRAPRTLQGWYFYNKTKNYRVMWGALKGGAVYGMKVVAFGGTWAALEDVSSRIEHVEKAREVVAGMGGAAIFSLFARLPWAMASKVLLLGAGTGGVLSGLRWMKEQMEIRAQKEEETIVP